MSPQRLSKSSSKKLRQEDVTDATLVNTLTSLTRALTGRSVLSPFDTYPNARILCNYKSSQGHLVATTKGLLFVPKP